MNVMCSKMWPVCILLFALACGKVSGSGSASADVELEEDAGVVTDSGQDADAERDGTSAQDTGGPAPQDVTPEPEDVTPEPDVVIDRPPTSAAFTNYIQAGMVPGRFPASECDALTEHHLCVTRPGCNWLRTIKDNGVCRQDPVVRCLRDGECECRAHDFHGDASHDEDLELFIPLSIDWQNRAPATSAFGGAEDLYTVQMSLPVILDESLGNFTSRTDFSQRSIDVRAPQEATRARLRDTSALSLTMKFMHVWDQRPVEMSGTLFEGLGVRLVVEDDALSVFVGDDQTPVTGEAPGSGEVKNYHCNQLSLVITEEDGARISLGGLSTPLPNLSMDTVRAALDGLSDDDPLLRIGTANAKIWDFRLYGNDRALTPADLGEIGKRCGAAGEYPIPEGYPESNRRYSWGMGGYDIVPNHEIQAYASGVYVTMRIPEPDEFPPTDEAYRDNLMRMIGFWDRWHEQMFFEMDLIPFVDTRELLPEGSSNTYRNYAEPVCRRQEGCGEMANYNNPCRYVTDLFQGFNWLPEDFPGEPTSADHRRISQRGGYGRWDDHDPDTYSSWSRPVHEHGHTAHFTLMRTYQKVHHYIRGIAGEGFAEIMSGYVLTGLKSWMNTALTYYSSIPLSFEGRWNGERHVFKSPQPYQENNIDDLGLGARFYGMGVWWTFVSHYAAKPYLVGWISGDTDQTPGTAMQRARFYLAQEGLDLGDLFGNYAAHVVTWDWPQIGHHFHDQDQDPFQGIAGWCTNSTGPDCTVDSLKVHADVDPTDGTLDQWVDGPADRQPGGMAHNTIRIANAPGGALYEISLDFEVPRILYPDTDYAIGLPSNCRDDDRFFSSRIVVAPAGSEGQAQRPRRPDYYKIPGRTTDRFIVQVPEGGDANIYLLPVPTPPFDLEDVQPFVQGFSLTWPYRYRVNRLDALPDGAAPQPPIVLAGGETLDLDRHEGSGFVHDCFYDPEAAEDEMRRAEALDACIAHCQTNGFGNSDNDISCNQQLSCRNACQMRSDGVPAPACEGHCDRTGNSGCTALIEGRSYNTCGPCTGDSRGDLPTECRSGCNFAP